MRILVASFFPAFHPPRSGGEQRYYYMYHHLSRWHDITLLSPTYSHHAAEVVTFSPSFREHRIPKDSVCDRLHWKLDDAGIGPECSALVVALAAVRETRFGQRFASLANEADLVIHESPFTLPYDRTISVDGKPRVYNAYNVEHRLATQFFLGDVGRKAVEFIRFLEHGLTRLARLVLVTCEEEGVQFREDFALEPGRIALAPNGFEPFHSSAPPEGASVRGDDALFMGSAHPPNVEAARYVVDALAPAMPATRFNLIGAVCEHLPGRLPANVTALGFVEEALKRKLLATCGAAINPLFSGAGTNLKMLDYMAAGAPIVTTRIGARGLALEDGVNAFIADGAEFAPALEAALTRKVQAARTGGRAREKAYRDYTWESIARRVHGAIEPLVVPPAPYVPGRSQPFVLVVNDFSVLHPTGGGQVRIHELLTELGRAFDVVLLCLSRERERYERRIAANVVEVGIPKTAEQRDAEVEAARGETVSIEDVLAADYCMRNTAFTASFELLAGRSAAVVFEHPFLAPMADRVPADVPVVYSSLNVEMDLKSVLLSSRRDAARRIARVAELEKALLERARLIVCVSPQDSLRFRREFPAKRFVVVENGSRVDRHARKARDRAGSGSGAVHRIPMLAVFVGSSHMPNVDGARFLIECVAPRVPEVVFALAGSVCDAVRLMGLPPNVALFGVLTEQEKNGLLRRATMAVNPLFDGGGSSLKVPDFLAAGLPLVSTSVGVRGYDLRDGTHYLSAGRQDFVEKVRLLARDHCLRDRLAAQGHAFAANELDWRVLGRKYRDALGDLTGAPIATRVLVVTYRFPDPALGGAEAYLANVLREIVKRGHVAVEVATPDVDVIRNQWHFSAKYQRGEGPRADPDYVEALHRFEIDEPPSETFARCSRLFALWMSETREHALRFLERYSRPILLGGWNFPEARADAVVRWSSRVAQIHVGPSAIGLRIQGFAPKSTRLDVDRGSERIKGTTVSGHFAWDMPLAAGDAVVSLTVRDVFDAPADPRELGVLIDAISVRTASEVSALDLGEDFAAVMRRDDPVVWVESLVDLATARERSDDDLFIEVRGPHSDALERWLDEHCRRYDVVLAHGVPFAPLVLATEIACKHGVPVVLLPHFHLEDRYYHWQSYYRAFRQANMVLAASALSKRIFLDRLGASSTIVPGGGLDLAEYGEERLSAGVRAFRARHTSATPFVLVLGRKAAGKNYRQVVEAVRMVNEHDHRVDLVLIGPDDDGLPLSAPHTCYYGVQPRDVVLGALTLALCLVNMSDSESFGIVLLEAWRAGIPVIAQKNCIAFADLVVTGRNGFLAQSSAEIARAIERYLDEPDLALSHAREGAALAGTYAWSEVAAQIEAVLLDTARGDGLSDREARGAPVRDPASTEAVAD